MEEKHNGVIQLSFSCLTQSCWGGSLDDTYCEYACKDDNTIQLLKVIYYNTSQSETHCAKLDGILQYLEERYIKEYEKG